jgi:YegS/Rv2252/BmrU family lipid kinase
MQHIFVLNPAAGQADSSTMLKEQILALYGESAVIYETRGIGDATAFVREYANAHKEQQLRFFACGGDGTFSEVVGGAVGFDHVAVGIVPVGTGNDFVRNFENKEHFLTLESQRDGSEISVDLLRCNDRYCVNMLNPGFDCEVVGCMQRIKRRVPSGMAYALGVLIELIKKPCATVKVIADGEVADDGKRLLCAVANGGFYGGGYHPLPHASISDGMIDVCLVKNVSRIRFITLIGKYKKGTHLSGKYDDILSCVKGKEYDISFDKPTPISVDGELVTVESIHMECVPGALSFIVPEGIAVPSSVQTEALLSV